MPIVADLPEELKKLTRRQYLNIDQTRLETDISKLTNIIDNKSGIKRRSQKMR